MRQIYDKVYCIYNGKPILGVIDRAQAYGEGKIQYYVRPVNGAGYANETEDVFDTKEELKNYFNKLVEAV